MKYKKFFLIMLLVVIIGGLIELIPSFLISIWNSDNKGFSIERVVVLMLILVLATVVQLLFIYVRERFASSYNSNNLKQRLRLYFKLNYDYINKKGTSNILERMIDDVNNTYAFMTGDFIQIWSSFLVVLVILVITSINNIYLAMVLLIMLPLNYFGFRLLNKELKKRVNLLQGNVAKGFQSILSVLSPIDYLKQLPDHEPIIEFLDPEVKTIYKSMANVNTLAKTASNLLSSLNSIVKTLILVVLVYSYLQTASDPYTLVLFTILMPLYFQHVSIITNANFSKNQMLASSEFIDELKYNVESEEGKEMHNIKGISFEITEIEVGETNIDITLSEDFSQGDVVWIQGESGVGKSSLVKLLPLFRENDNIYINNCPITDYSRKSVRTQIDYLSQQVPIIKGTLRDNLFFGFEWSKGKEDLILKQPLMTQLLKYKKLDTIIDENGANISGGEKQKIAILRALMRDPDVIILDEVTSSIDKESAINIYDELLIHSQERITFIISHDNLPEKYATKVVKLI